MIEATVATWIEALTFNRAWDESRDAPRIRHAFKVLGANRRDWPKPVDLVEHLPAVPKRLELPSRIVDQAVAEANIARIKRLLKGEE